MRTTVNLADDVARAVEKIRRERAIGLSEAINELIRSGLAKPPAGVPFEQQTHDMGPAHIDYTNVWKAIEIADGAASH